MNDINSEDTRGTRNTFYNLSLHSEVYWSSENNSLFANIPETVVDHRIPIIFGTSPADHRPHALTYDQHQNHSTPSIDTLGNSHQLTNDSGGPPTTNEANDFEDQPGACSESVPAQIHQPSETAPYEQLTWLREDNQGDVGEQGPPSYEESMRPYGQLRKGNQEDMDEHGPCPPSYDEFMRQHQV
ncbi:uncharacterized protein [Ptychodera flava]|uniref:uncharacterized protein n=1 Tax=Ptychodera flava TaxID=63121 RepID=UPI00396AA4A3